MGNNLVIINAHRDVYNPNYINYTLTVGELIEKLNEYPEDAIVCTSQDNNFTFGPLSGYDIKLTSLSVFE